MSVTDRYKESCVQFSLDWYVGRVVSSGAVKVYTHLLREYATNGLNTNHHIVSFFTRLCKYKLDVAKTAFDGGEKSGEKGRTKEEAVTLEPLLFNMEVRHVATVSGYGVATKYYPQLTTLLITLRSSW